MGIRHLIESFVNADVRRDAIEPYRAAGGDAYELIDQAPPASWARLAAWNAFMFQVYADALVAAGATSRYVPRDTAVFARNLYAWANTWVKQTHMALASETYRFQFVAPHPLPHWENAYRTDAQLEGMRFALDTGRTRAASDLHLFERDSSAVGTLRVRLAEVDAEADYISRLWRHERSPELRFTLGGQLTTALDHAFGLGHLLAQPRLLDRLR